MSVNLGIQFPNIITSLDSNTIIRKANAFVKQNVEKTEIKAQERSSDGLSNRSLLANALETTVQNEFEKNKLRLYKEKIALLNAEEQKLTELRSQIKEMSFSKGKRDTAKLSELKAEATKTANRINNYDRQLLTLEASKPLKEVLAREKTLAYKQAQQEGKTALNKYRERVAERTQSLVEKYRVSRENAAENREKTAVRHKIKSVVSDLNKLLLHGTKERNVKLGLQEAVASALEAINMDTVDADGRITALELQLEKAKTAEKKQEILRKIENIRAMGERMDSKLSALKEAYGKIRTGNAGGNLPVYYVEEANLIENRIESVMDKVGDTPLRNMSLDQLNSVYDLYKMVLTTVRNTNKVWREGKLVDLQESASNVMKEVQTLPKIKEERSRFGEKIRSFSWNEMTPYYAFERTGSKTLTSYFWDAIEHSRMLSKKEIAKKVKQVSEAENRIKTLNKVIQSLYEDKVLGKILEERFIVMSEAYEQEQFTLKETIANSKCEIERYDEINDNINNFVSIVGKAGRIKKLTPEIVRLLIDKIIVSEKVKTESGYKRTVTIFLTHIGEIELP